MALLRGKDVPEGSLRLSEEEAIQYQLKLINGWEPKSDVNAQRRLRMEQVHAYVTIDLPWCIFLLPYLHHIENWKKSADKWPFHFGFGILGAGSALSAMYINSHFRSRLRLHAYGRMSTYLPIVILPSMLSALFHHVNVSMDILIQKTPCPLCVQMRASAIQVGFSAVYPTLLAPLAGFMMASHYNTYRLPHLTEDPKAVFGVWKKMVKPLGSTLYSIAIAQALIAMWVTYCEAKSYYRVQEVLNMDSEFIENS